MRVIAIAPALLCPVPERKLVAAMCVDTDQSRLRIRARGFALAAQRKRREPWTRPDAVAADGRLRGKVVFCNNSGAERMHPR
jgi:hypothetical protein